MSYTTCTPSFLALRLCGLWPINAYSFNVNIRTLFTPDNLDFDPVITGSYRNSSTYYVTHNTTQHNSTSCPKPATWTQPIDCKFQGSLTQEGTHLVCDLIRECPPDHNMPGCSKLLVHLVLDHLQDWSQGFCFTEHAPIIMEQQNAPKSPPAWAANTAKNPEFLTPCEI